MMKEILKQSGGAEVSKAAPERTLYRVKSVTINGNVRMKIPYFESEFKHIVAHTGASQEDFGAMLSQSIQKLRGSDLFEKVEFSVEETTNEDVISQLKQFKNGITEVPVNVSVNVTEKNLYKIGAGAFVVSSSNKPSSAETKFDAMLRSPLGYGEQVGLGSSIDAVHGSLYRGFVTVPQVPFMSNYKGVLRYKAYGENNSNYLSFTKEVESFKIKMQQISGGHSFELEASLRDEVPSANKLYSAALGDVVKNAGEHVMGNASSSTKVSFRHVYSRDGRDCAVDPTSGQLLTHSTELALPFGTAQFLKLDSGYQYHRTIGSSLYNKAGLTTSVCASAGLILPLDVILKGLDSSSSRAVHLADRYHLGGPLSLRGFDHYGVGGRCDPRKGGAALGDACGGTSILSLLSYLSIPFPFSGLKDYGRAFAFINAGSLGSCDYWRPPSPGQTRSLAGLLGLDALRASLGGGVVVNVNNSVRIECTYSLPLLKADRDVVKPFQLGLGLTVN